MLEKITKKFVWNLMLLLVLATIGFLLFSRTAVVAALAIALGVKHITFILVEMDIFVDVRNYLKRKRHQADNMQGWQKMFWRKPYILFKCPVCMSVWVSFWLVVLPLAIIANYRHSHPLEHWLGVSLPLGFELLFSGLALLFATMILAALAMAWWQTLEFSRYRLEAQVAIERGKTLVHNPGDLSLGKLKLR